MTFLQSPNYKKSSKSKYHTDGLKISITYAIFTPNILRKFHKNGPMKKKEIHARYEYIKPRKYKFRKITCRYGKDTEELAPDHTVTNKRLPC